MTNRSINRTPTFEAIRFTTDIGDLGDRELVVEAVFEAEEAKVAVFSALDKVVAESGAILASNTSSIPIMKLAMATSRPQQVVGIHLDERAIAGSGIDTAGLRPIARCGGPGDYTVVERIFKMTRPTS